MSKNTPPLVYVIVLNYKTPVVTSRCLFSLQNLTYSNYRTLVVDNYSQDGSAQEFTASFPCLTILQTGCNLGYSGGNNVGIEYAAVNGADYVLILNPDTVVANPMFLDEMVGYLESASDVGIIGPRVFFQSTEKVQNTVLFAPGFFRNLINWFAYRISPDSFELSGDKVTEAQVLNGVCLLLRVECLKQIGLFDERIFMYVEDADLDYRARQSGWKVQYLPIDSVAHLQKQEGYEMTGEVSFLLKRNSVYYLHKTGRVFGAWLMASSFLVALLIRGTIRFELGKHYKMCLRLLSAFSCIFKEKYNSDFGKPFTEGERS